MAVFHKSNFHEDGSEAAERMKVAKAAREKAERDERKLLRELEELEAKGKVDPPPELSPSERKERELVERLDQLEGKEQAERLIGQGVAHGRLESPEQNRRKEALRLLRIRKAAREQDERDKEHEKRCANQIKQLETLIAETEAKRSTEEGRHAEAMAELGSEHRELSEKLAALVRSLGPDETTETRLEAVAI